MTAAAAPSPRSPQPFLPHAVHLVDADRLGWSALRLAATAIGPRATNRALILARPAARRRAEHCGFAHARFISAPAGWVLAARSAARRFIGRPEAICAWGANAALLARLTWPRAELHTVLTHQSSAFSRLAGTILPRCQHVWSINDDAAPAPWTERLAPGIVPQPLPIEPPAIDPSLAPTRAELRAAWDVPDDAYVITPLGEPAESIDALLMSYLAGVLTFAGYTTIALVPPESAGLERARRLAAHHAGAWRVIVDPSPPWIILRGCDAAVWHEPPALPPGHRRRTPPLARAGTAWAQQLGIPIIGNAPPHIRSTTGMQAGLRLAQELLRTLSQPEGNE